MQIDTLINARWVVPVEPADTVLDEHSIAIDKGRIVDVLPSSAARTQVQAREIIDRGQHIVIPGLVNAHTHAAMSLLRGLADDMPLMTWLSDHIWPAEARYVGEDFVHDGTRLAIAEMLRGGTTCFNDMYFFPDVTARVATEAGMRACIGLIVVDFPSAWASGPDEYLAKGTALHDSYRNDPLVRTLFAPHAPYSVSDDALQRIRMFSDELDLPIHMHVHETRDEIEQGLEKHGNRPLQRLAELGLLSPALRAVHMTHVNDEEFASFAASGAHIVHCPESNLKLASGNCQVARWLEAGVNVALGTDGAASNNDLDMLSEMRSAALLGKGVAGDATAVPAATALQMATLNGARALGLEHEIGSLVPGKAADLVAIDLSHPRCQPVYHPLSTLVYATDAGQVSDTWIAGRHLLKNGQLMSLDETEILQHAVSWGNRIGSGDQGILG